MKIRISIIFVLFAITVCAARASANGDSKNSKSDLLWVEDESSDSSTTAFTLIADEIKESLTIQADTAQKYNWLNLTRAVEQNDLTVARFLLERGVNPNQRGANEWPPLYYASSAEMVDLLSAYGADINATDSFQCTPMDMMVFSANVEAFKKLASLGAKYTRAKADLESTLVVCSNQRLQSEISFQKVCQKIAEMDAFLKKIDAERRRETEL